MAAQQFGLKVKNTFIHIDSDDDTLDICLDEGETPKRQVTEPAPYTVPLLDVPVSKLIEQTKYFSETLEESTTSSDHDLKDTEPFQPEAEPDLRLNEMARMVTEEVCWNTWSGNQPELHIEQYCIGPVLGQAVPQQYAVVPVVQAIPADALLDREEHPRNGLSPQPSTTNKKQRDHEKDRHRRKRESLIDIAARKQKHQQKQQQKRGSQQQRSQAAETHGNPSVPPVAKFCHRCGAACSQDYKFCRFCGTAVLSMNA